MWFYMCNSVEQLFLGSMLGNVMQYPSQFRKDVLVYSLIIELSRPTAVEVAPLNPYNSFIGQFLLLK